VRSCAWTSRPMTVSYRAMWSSLRPTDDWKGSAPRGVDW